MSVLSDVSDICTFGMILKALLQDQMSDSLKSIPYNIDHKILNIAPTEKYDISMYLSDCIDYAFSIYYSIGFETLGPIIKFIQIKNCVFPSGYC